MDRVSDHSGGQELPNLLVIGAPKAGTTSLHSYLSQHPDVSMSIPKELRFFWRDDWYQRRDWYARHFRADATIRGESTPGYTMWPVHDHVPERAAQLVPEAKIIYVVRDPVDRIFSHYYQRLSDGDRTLLSTYIDSVERPDNLLICPSRYHTQLSRWLRCFAQSQVLIVDQEDLRTHRDATVEHIFEFLGVGGAANLALDAELNTSAQKYAPTTAGRVGQSVGLWQLSARLPEAIKRPLRPALHAITFRKLDVALTLDAGQRRRLEYHLRTEADAFRECVGRPFDSWTV